jgi:hypothetical protein
MGKAAKNHAIKYFTKRGMLNYDLIEEHKEEVDQEMTYFEVLEQLIPPEQDEFRRLIYSMLNPNPKRRVSA